MCLCFHCDLFYEVTYGIFSVVALYESSQCLKFSEENPGVVRVVLFDSLRQAGQLGTKGAVFLKEDEEEQGKGECVAGESCELLPFLL